MKIFRPRNHFSMEYILYWILGIILIISILSLFTAPALIKETPGLVILLLIILYFFILGIKRITYKISTDDKGNLIEKALFKKTRIINISDIESISPRSFDSDTILKGVRLFGRRPKISAPKIINSKFPDFPRYIMPEVFYEEIIKTAPQVKVDVNLNIKS